MTRKDFELIAQWFYNARPDSRIQDIEYPFEYDQWKRTVYTFAEGLKNINPRFNTAKFVKACEKGLG